MRYLPKLISIAISLSVLGILLKMAKFGGANVLFLISMMTLATLLYVYAFFNKNKPQGAFFAILYRISFMGMAIMAIGILFRFLYWRGWATMLMVSILPFMACLFLLYKLKMENMKMLRGQPGFSSLLVLLPFCFLAIAFVISVGVPDKDFYYTFSAQSKTKTYEQFQQEIANAKLYPHSQQQNTTNP